MRSSAVLTILSSVLAAASYVPHAPRAVTAESIVNATALGVDVFGPIPNDAVKLGEGHYQAEPGTKAWAWIRAQADLPVDESQPEKRQQYANMGVGLYIGDLCTGQAVWWDNIFYGYRYWSTVNMFSVGIRSRSLRSNEKIDFSRGDGVDYCATYLYTIASGTPVGCFNSQLVNCFRLTMT
ncbi:hypothetical protein HIM_09129 [Hirsutella minnesotensis 3608]|uniref:Uncharacterized protein n=1 Tax=Hirsutella minnesotensis 3608 TaxID=1043627 RepID=A0A0F7ZLV2_9HYPO|nr:hypothetical protein HIM_09129 [Hirsutella minnesotensis 3608]